MDATAASKQHAVAHTLQSLVYLLNSEAAELHVRSLTENPHQYGDVLYGTCVPHLAMAAEAVAGRATL